MKQASFRLCLFLVLVAFSAFAAEIGASTTVTATSGPMPQPLGSTPVDLEFAKSGPEEEPALAINGFHRLGTHHRIGGVFKKGGYIYAVAPGIVPAVLVALPASKPVTFELNALPKGTPRIYALTMSVMKQVRWLKARYVGKQQFGQETSTIYKVEVTHTQYGYEIQSEALLPEGQYALVFETEGNVPTRDDPFPGITAAFDFMVAAGPY